MRALYRIKVQFFKNLNHHFKSNKNFKMIYYKILIKYRTLFKYQLDLSYHFIFNCDSNKMSRIN